MFSPSLFKFFWKSWKNDAQRFFAMKFCILQGGQKAGGGDRTSPIYIYIYIIYIYIYMQYYIYTYMMYAMKHGFLYLLSHHLRTVAIRSRFSIWLNTQHELLRKASQVILRGELDCSKVSQTCIPQQVFLPRLSHNYSGAWYIGERIVLRLWWNFARSATRHIDMRCNTML